ncbi:MAG: long-chain fatty acid--CoA ligase [Anaerolineae bacterium]|nr:long-chain fatty acid--CoA ligase [Anaerolineae bacterium]MDW8070946.1 long-chain fatty acid--CoA ligase [Anaerolineae bacterium]
MEARVWHQHYPPQLPTSLEYPAITLDGLLRDTARQHPHKAALIFAQNTITYRELDALVSRLAAALQQLGVHKGDRVALYLPNCPQMVIGYFAVWRLGGIAVPVNIAYVAREFVQQVRNAGATVALCWDAKWEALREAVSTSGLRHVVLTGLEEFATRAWVSASPATAQTIVAAAPEGHADGAPRVHRLSDLLRADPTTLAASKLTPEDTAALLYTGGTTGVPKGAQLTHRNLVTNAVQIAHWLTNLAPGEERVLTALPLTHSYALTMCMNQSVYRAYTQVLIANPRQLDELLAAVDAHQVTLFPGVPTLFLAVNQHPGVRAGEYRLRSLKACISGAAPLPREVQQEFQRITGGMLVEGYGLTEASPITHCNPLHGADRSGTIGLPLPDTDCKIVDSETETQSLGPEQPGVLCVSGPQLMVGYWEMPEETANVLRRDHTGKLWLHTGDIAVMSADGYFRIVDRKKDTIVALGGLKVYPREVEDVLYAHPAVLEAAVIGVPVGGADQRVKAFIVLRPGAQADEEAIRAFCQERLAPYKVPKFIEFRDTLPKSGVGKVLRRYLAEEEVRA